MVTGGMFKHARTRHDRPRYEAYPFKRMPGRSWMVYDDRVSRVVAFPLYQDEAYTLAHTLNVADLRAPIEDFGDHSRSPDRS